MATHKPLSVITSYSIHYTKLYEQKQLSEMGIEFTTGYVKTGILGVIKGKNPDKKIIALRADMDALPIKENTCLTFTSKNT